MSWSHLTAWRQAERRANLRPATSHRVGSPRPRGTACPQRGRPTLGPTEYEVRDRVHAIGAKVPDRSEPAEKGVPRTGLTCPHCQQDARFVTYRPKGLLSLLGPIRPARAYYHCKHCHQGYFPSDHVLGLTTGDLDARCRSGGQPCRIAGASPRGRQGGSLPIGGASFRRPLLNVPPRWRGKNFPAPGGGRGGCEAEAALAWHKDAEGKTCAYVSLMLLSNPQQGPGAAKAEGRMATVAMVYNPVPEDRGTLGQLAG